MANFGRFYWLSAINTLKINVINESVLHVFLIKQPKKTHFIQKCTNYTMLVHQQVQRRDAVRA